MKKKISQIIAYSVLAVVVLAFVLCSIIKVSFKPEVNMPLEAEVGKVQISTTDGTSKVESNSNNINLQEFNKKFNNAFELTVLYSVFSGKMGKEVEREKLNELPKQTGFKVQFIYNELQTLKVDGKTVYVADNSTTPIKFNMVVFSVEEGKGLANVNMYFYTNGESAIYELSTIANFDSLYNHISNMSMFGE